MSHYYWVLQAHASHVLGASYKDNKDNHRQQDLETQHPKEGEDIFSK